MTLKLKILVSLASILGLLILASFFAYHESKQVDLYRQKAVASEAQVLAATDIRAKVRSQLLTTLQALFVEDPKQVSKRLKESEEVVEKRIVDYEKTLEVDFGLSDQLPTQRTFHTEVEEIRAIRESCKGIANHLERSVVMFESGDAQGSKKLLQYAINVLFKEFFLKKITATIDAETLDLRRGSEQLAQSTARLRLIFFYFVLLAIGLSGILTFYLSRSLGGRLTRLEEATQQVARGDFNIALPAGGSDEISLLSVAFNQMATSLGVAQTQLGQQQQLIISTSKMSALGEMAGGIAHEINNPLAVIQMRSEQLSELVSAGELDLQFLAETAEVIARTTSRIAKIVKGLRTFSRDGDQDPYLAASIQEIIEGTLELCQERLKSNGIRIDVNVDQTPVILECRATQISQVLLNLMSNASDAISALDKKWIEIDVVENPKNIEIRITDSGHGIPKEIQDKLMQPFFTTKEIGKGTGLGLSISRGIIRAHQGEFFLDKHSENTRFVIVLPKMQSQMG